ncbi:DUF3899 domain-containing protein [Domibacillus sp. DTU_2020_1001157_1_SI_ALB_TIR_016]|uniref:DUF3899 domain-containing protein n=1 Tax=Domibacillus sp. DTU_2020_1001157_1_SI_ALB_TIR_016 TaxID=3077789 RepID=UPI0028E18A6C|nr:DUF3899 domain-containing protein [Domibacillus sp. DTU_2020_1001157_1_SI_ALB_TIR_016]WNS80056.1 DUF3899 domain-containing protein [Domibacillus sp. DTU_2020_1001157_1_SI_ALB_TIR_016]
MGKKIFFLAFVLLAGSLFYSLTKPSHLIAFVNAAFMGGLFFFIIGASMLVFEKGFFNGISFGFKQLRTSSKEGSYTARFDDLDKTGAPHEEYKKRTFSKWTLPLLLTGGAAALLTLLSSYFLSS